MKPARGILVIAILLLATANLIASGPVGFYAVIQRVVFEPTENAPERIQVWGAFAVFDKDPARPGATSKPLRGYLYFKLPEGNAQAAAKTEWADLKSVAGTGQAVGFGNWGFVGRVEAVDYPRPNASGIPYFLEFYPGGGRQTNIQVRRKYDASAMPAVYQTNAGVVKLPENGSHAEIVKQLRDALKTQ
jgi:hypothetical protein